MFKYVFVFSLVLIFSACETSSEKNIRHLTKSATELNEKCPQMLDSETRLDRIEIKEPNTLVYKFTLVNALAANMDTVLFYRAMWPGLISTIKVSPEMKKMRENETSIEYSYNDKNNKPVYTFRISSKDYAN